MFFSKPFISSDGGLVVKMGIMKSQFHKHSFKGPVQDPVPAQVHADTRIVGAAGALEEQPEGVDAEVEVRQVHSFNSSISSFRDDAL